MLSELQDTAQNRVRLPACAKIRADSHLRGAAKVRRSLLNVTLVLNAGFLFLAACIGGAMNSVAGGGSFFSFPALLLFGLQPPFGGLDPKIANATNAVALWPGSAASVGAYRRELRHQRETVKLLAWISMIGGLAGALLLLITPSDVFEILLPYLMLGATLLFTFSPRINRAVRRMQQQRSVPADSRQRTILLQAIISIYGGFFGGGIGIMMLATLALMGMEHIHEMNALKTLLATLINGIAVVAFAVAGVVAWPQALLMAIGAIIGGYGGAALARRLNPLHVRLFVIVVGFALSGYLFYRAWGVVA